MGGSVRALGVWAGCTVSARPPVLTACAAGAFRVAAHPMPSKASSKNARSIPTLWRTFRFGHCKATGGVHASVAGGLARWRSTIGPHATYSKTPKRGQSPSYAANVTSGGMRLSPLTWKH